MAPVTSKNVNEALLEITTGIAANAASGNDLVARVETPALVPVMQSTDKTLRAEGGSGTLVRIAPLSQRTVDDTLAALAQISPPVNAQDAAFVSKDEVAQLVASDPERGALFALAYARAARLAPQSASDAAAAAKAKAAFAVEPDLRARLGRQGDLGTLIDVRPGRAERSGVPTAVLESFDYYYQAEAADWAGTTLRKLTLGDATYYAVMLSTDGDEGLLEVLSAKGKALASARFNGDTLLPWDAHFGIARSVGGLSRLGRRGVEGYSEDPTRRANHQITSGWRPDVTVGSGFIQHDTTYVVGLNVTQALTPEQDEVMRHAFNVMMERHFRFAYRFEPEIEIGMKRAGTLRIGTFVHPSEGVDYVVADWKDIDNAKFTLYFKRMPSGALQLAIEQSNG